MPKSSQNALGSSFSANKSYKAWTPQKPVSDFGTDMLQIKPFNSEQVSRSPYYGVDFQP